MKPLPWRVFAAAGIVIAGFSFVLGIYSFGLSDKNATERDFIEYWAAGQQLAHGANPYDVPSVLHLEQTVGLNGSEPKVTLSPPLILLLALPLGFVGPKTGLILWLVALLCSLVASILLLWRLYGSPPTAYHWIGIGFAPAVACLEAGQISIFVLLGLVLFLDWHRSRPFLAGAALLPCALKPHLFLSFAVVLLLWVLSRRLYRILTGFAVALATGCALTLGLDRHAWGEYAQLSHSNRILHLFVPTLSSYIRFQVDGNAVWLQLLPAFASCIWAAWYFWTRRGHWDWMDQGLLVLLVSLVCAPYAFFFDEAVLLPAVLAGIYRAVEARRSLLPFGLISAAALTETCAGVTLVGRFYLWTTPAWLAWYLYASRTTSTWGDRSGTSVDAPGNQVLKPTGR